MPVEKGFFESMEFFQLSADGTKFFGFSEFLAGLALMVLAWTIADVRYRFRVQTAPVPLHGLTFGVVAAVGVLTLMTDLWRAEQWLVPRGNFLSPASWQAVLAGLFLFTFLAWTWFAFIRPPRFGRLNKERYLKSFYRVILKGSPAELAIIADELWESIPSIVRSTTPAPKLHRIAAGALGGVEAFSKIELCANDLLLLVGDKRFCRALVESSPETAMALFQEMLKEKKYTFHFRTFARNFLSAAIANKDSFIYHEDEGYKTGLLGYHKPLSQAMFSDFEMVEALYTMLDVDYDAHSAWDAEQWSVYCRVVLAVFRGYCASSSAGHSYVLTRAFDLIGRSMSDLYQLNDTNFSADNDISKRLDEIVRFILECVKVIDEDERPNFVRLRLRGTDEHVGVSIYDRIARMVFDVMLATTAVRSPTWQSWEIQHNSVWSTLFSFDAFKGKGGRIVAFKLRRILYGKVADLKRFPNYEGARVLAYCLNVMGIQLRTTSRRTGMQALHMAILAWTSENYSWLRQQNDDVANTCLPNGTSFDVENSRLVRTYPANALRRSPEYIYLNVVPHL